MSKPQGLDWEAITNNYVEAGGELQPEVWGSKAAAKVSKPKTSTPRRQVDDAARPNGLKTELSAPKLEELVVRYRAGESSLSLGRAYGLSPQTVIRILREQGVEIRPRAEKVQIPALDFERAKIEYRAGKSVRKVAALIEVPETTLKTALKEAGFDLRDRAESARMAWVKP
jgi:hypothetical protein